MKYSSFNATCPYEIGDRFNDMARGTSHTITDIVCVHYVKSGRVEFAYELDNSGEYAVIREAVQDGINAQMR